MKTRCVCAVVLFWVSLACGQEKGPSKEEKAVKEVERQVNFLLARSRALCTLMTEEGQDRPSYVVVFNGPVLHGDRRGGEFMGLVFGIVAHQLIEFDLDAKNIILTDSESFPIGYGLVLSAGLAKSVEEKVMSGELTTEDRWLKFCEVVKSKPCLKKMVGKE